MLLVFHLSTCCQGICYPGFNLDSVKLHTTKLLKTQWLTGQSFRLSMNYHSFKPSRALPMVERSTCLQSWEDETHNFTVGPLAGDLAEIETLCRLQRLAEQLHKVVMDSLRRLDDEGTMNKEIGTVNEEIGFSSSLEEVVVAGLACVGATLHQGRLDILTGSSDDEDERPPRLARFRSKLRGCCKSLRASLQSLIPAKGEENLAVYRTLQRLMNLCLDAGYFRPDGAPLHGYVPNFAAVKLRTDDSLAEFWRSGQVTEEGLEWLLRNEFKTIVDIRDEEPEDEMAESAMLEAEASGKIRRIKLPVQVETAPTMEQVREFARIVAEPSNKPLLLQSYAGVIRPSAMVSRWREFVRRGGLECEEEECEVEDLWLDSPSDEVSRVNGDETKSNITPSISPFQAQVPKVEDVFSRKHMSRFFKSKRTTPSTLFSQLQKQKVVVKYFDDRGASSDNGGLMAGNDTASERRLTKSSSNGGMRSSSQGNDVDAEVDMCASKTGVVRLQSRKKAEMYLVRADGFSCSRERVTESTLAFTHPSTQQQMLMWKTAPKTVLLLKKLGDELMEEAKLVASFLHEQEEMNVMVEPELHDRFARYAGFGYVQTFYNHDIGELHERVDFVVCLGGDGVILHASNLFRSSVPPVVSFNLGSLGFLTAHPFENYKQDLRAIIHGNKRIEGVYVTLRMRLRCEILRDGQPLPGKVFEVLNEVVVDRGSNPYLCKIECYERNRLITKVQADGVLVATPTGSTAYSTSAGGSMVHPNVPCMLFTPICPHSLSFRPVILPDSAILELKVPDDARSSAFVSFDGKSKHPLKLGESIRIRMSEHPMSTVNKSDQTNDWFASLSRCFGWNQRVDQKSL